MLCHVWITSGWLAVDMKLADTILLVSLMGKYFSTHFKVKRPLGDQVAQWFNQKLTAFLHQGHHYHYICHHHLKGFAEYETIQMQPNSKKLGNLFELFRDQNALKRFDNQIDPRFLQFCGPIVG